MELIENLGINVPLLIAQIVNFFLLLFILKKFVYKPVLNVLDERAQRVKKSMEDAKKIEDQVKENEKMRIEKLHSTEKECGVILEKAKAEAEKTKQELLAYANMEVEKLINRGKEKLKEEKMKIIEELKQQMASVIVAASTKILERSVDKEDEKKLLDAINREISTLS